MRIISVNVNGIRAAQKKGFFKWLAQVDPDIVCIQETKSQEDQLDNSLFYPNDYYCYFFDAQKKGYSGVAIYSKIKPNKVIRGFGPDMADMDEEGRYIQADFTVNGQALSVASIYVPSGTSGDIRQQVKYSFMDRYTEVLKSLRRKRREYVLCGDWNIVHKEIDIKNWKSNQKNSGCLPEERAWLDQLFGPLGFVDAFRVVNQEKDQYTWWSFRGQAWAKNVGWRIDYQVITPKLKDKVEAASIYKAERFSDHAPLIIDYTL